MIVYHNELPLWVEIWETTGSIIPTEVARTIAEYQAMNGSRGELAVLASGVYRLDSERFHDDIAEALQIAKVAGSPLPVINELHALKAWAQHYGI